jgi:hypothetical protein
MVHTETVFQLLYVSQLAPGRKSSCVSDIVSVSRAANAARGITGALIFDGEYFCQLIEGDEVAVRALMQRIEHDPRHVNVVPLFSRQDRNMRLTRSWRSGYCETHQLGAFALAEAPRGEAALTAFLTVLDGADME